MTTPRQHAINVMKFGRTAGLGLLKGFPEDKYTFQTGPTDNHVAWVLGHLAGTDGWMAGALGLKGVVELKNFQELYGSGSKPVADAKRYPSAAELRQALDTNRALLLNWLEGASEKDLAQSLSEKTGGFMLDPIDGAMKLAWHDGWHFGQLATLRKALGLPATM